MKTFADYKELISNFFSTRPKFNDTLQVTLQPFIDLQVFVANIPQEFDLDYAIGVQLDILGQWIGISRNIKIPIPDPWFRLDDIARGLDKGIWFQIEFNNSSTVLSTLDDETYRRVLKAKVLANKWNGTTEQLESILSMLFNDIDVKTFVQDNGLGMTPEMGFKKHNLVLFFGVSGKIPPITLLTILEQNMLAIEPAGIKVKPLSTSKNNTPIFGLDINNSYVGGLDAGSWGIAPSKTIEIAT